MKAQGAAMRPWRKMGELEIQQLNGRHRPVVEHAKERR